MSEHTNVESGDTGAGDTEIEDSPAFTAEVQNHADATIKVTAGFAVRGAIKRMVYRAANRFDPRLEVELQEEGDEFSSTYTFTLSGPADQVEKTHTEISAWLKAASKVTVKS
jgi:hypothetical protein